MRPVQVELFEPLPASIRHHPSWEIIAQWLMVEPAEPGRVRLEFTGVPEDQLGWLLDVEVACADCGRPIRPIRSRKAGNRRGDSKGHGLYLAVACPISTRIGCSRGSLARSEYILIQSALWAMREVRP